MHTRHTLSLDANWDVHLDEAGGIAVSTGAAATAQDVANECRLFTRDAYFAYDKGLPHKMVELGAKVPPIPLLRTLMRRAALRVPDVAEVLSVVVEDFDRERRRLTGSLEIRTREESDVVVEL